MKLLEDAVLTHKDATKAARGVVYSFRTGNHPVVNWTDFKSAVDRGTACLSKSLGLLPILGRSVGLSPAELGGGYWIGSSEAYVQMFLLLHLQRVLGGSHCWSLVRQWVL